MSKNQFEDWLQRELELSQRHEEIVLRREALLRGTEAYYDSQLNESASFVADLKKAKIRNAKLLQDWRLCMQDLKEDMRSTPRTPHTPRFETVKNNYWSMVKNVYPVWHEELREYNKRHGIPVTPRANSPRQQTLPDNPSPGSTMRSMQGSLRSQQGSTLRSTFGQGQGSTLKSTGGQPQGILKSPGSTLRSGTGTMKSTSFKT